MSTKGRIFIVDDDELIVSVLSRALKAEGYSIMTETKGLDVVNKAKSWSPDIILLDIKFPDRSGMDILREIKNTAISPEVIMLTADDSAEMAVQAMKFGATDYLTKPFNLDEVKIVIRNVIGKKKLQKEVDYLRKVTSKLIEKDIIGESGFIKELKAEIVKIAQARVSTVLITGESGTGKEVAARSIHHLMHNGGSLGYAPFVVVNCAALPENLLESELFGYEKGAFTDAKSDKKGVFELANEGTILLDEIGEMQLGLQSKLLRVLENRKLRRLGGQAEIDVDVTVIATTNRDLSEAVTKSDFRLDLFYRLNTFSLHMAPLRERREDIPILARHFLVRFAETYNKKTIKGFSSDAEQLLCSHNWMGNVRELKNIIERIVVLESTDVILPEHLPREIRNHTILASQPAKGKFVLPETGLSFDELEKDFIIQALERASHNKMQAAKLLDIGYDALRYKMKKFNLE